MKVKTFKSEDTYDILDDIQRVEENCLFLKSRLLALCGIDLTLDIKEDWTREDIPTIEQMERIRSNCEKLAKAVKGNFSIPAFGDYFDYIHANRLELALQIVKETLDDLIAIIDRPRAGLYFAAEPIVLFSRREGE